MYTLLLKRLKNNNYLMEKKEENIIINYSSKSFIYIYIYIKTIYFSF